MKDIIHAYHKQNLVVLHANIVEPSQAGNWLE